MSRIFPHPGERAVNHVLRGAPRALDRLRPHAGRTVAFRVGPLAMALTVQTTPVGPTRRANAAARSPLPEATSSTLEPARTPLISMAKRFHSRCSPSDMRSFIRS